MKALTDHPDQRQRVDRRLRGRLADRRRGDRALGHAGHQLPSHRATRRRGRRPGDQGRREGRDVLQLGQPRRARSSPTRTGSTSTRTPNEHVGFGAGGPHFCLGANLARREISVMFEEILRRLPDIEITGPPDLLQSGFIHGIKRMPCAWTTVVAYIADPLYSCMIGSLRRRLDETGIPRDVARGSPTRRAEPGRARGDDRHHAVGGLALGTRPRHTPPRHAGRVPAGVRLREPTSSCAHATPASTARRFGKCCGMTPDESASQVERNVSRDRWLRRAVLNRCDPERSVCTVLARHDVDYVLIGGLAANLHGSPVVTNDADICPRRNTARTSNGSRARCASSTLGSEPTPSPTAFRSPAMRSSSST